MNVSHQRPLDDPARGSFHGTALCYRTEIANTNTQPIRIIWFQFFRQVDGVWYGHNMKNRVLQADDFATWYAEGDSLENGWLLPGKVAACDPNWHGGELDPFSQVKWAFMAMDATGQVYFDEAEVMPENVQRFTKEPH